MGWILTYCSGVCFHWSFGCPWIVRSVSWVGRKIQRRFAVDDGCRTFLDNGHQLLTAFVFPPPPLKKTNCDVLSGPIGLSPLPLSNIQSFLYTWQWKRKLRLFFAHFTRVVFYCCCITPKSSTKLWNLLWMIIRSRIATRSNPNPLKLASCHPWEGTSVRFPMPHPQFLKYRQHVFYLQLE